MLFSAVVEGEFASLTSSLPDGLDNVTGGQAGTDGEINWQVKVPLETQLIASKLGQRKPILLDCNFVI